MIGRVGTSYARMVVLFAIWLLSPAILALRTTSGSPCAGVCGTTTNTTSDEITCLDRSYNGTKTGKNFENCISCQLDSEFHDANTGESDVNWGLYNLRYAFSTCVFGYPDSISNVSSPCPVACDGVRFAVETDIEEPSTSNLDAWCDTPTFADNVVNTCEFCYNLTTTQVYMANFLESIRYNCHFKTVTGKRFNIDPTRIFTQSLLPSSLSLTTPGSSSSNINLGVVIAVPIVGFLLILVSLTICCFFFIRHRRKKARRTRQSGQMYNRWNDPNGQWAEQYASGGHGYGPGLGFMDNDGRGQELPYGHGSPEQYQHQYQQFQGHDKSGFSNQITEQNQVPVQSPVLDPDQKRPQQW
ncbi:unnamed protein product [Penicillium salamii]|uniref:Uncharacterized protein n=1 Tax=Penicillium salamii TaxID=1612424 RepID=A0A9W4INA4_9EURO|nr:unnamed protein product [Penicillium salamii]CAG8310116.1 unnamed protein product [Penicillium salamii]CAG8375289.1 unnamed protein product [Penicillium salamii]CAG8409825.1 unnamed protein product [Penicillium salamii]